MISAECNDNPKKVFEYYLKHQEESKRSGKYRFVNTPLERIHAAPSTEQTDEPAPEERRAFAALNNVNSR